MLLDDTARCEGAKTATGKPLGLCVACERNTPGPADRPFAMLLPAAVLRPMGSLGMAWDCENRRSSGYVESEADLAGEG